MEDRAAQDLRLVASVLAGDSSAYGELVARYERMVASVAWRYGIPQAEIEDVTSEVFIKAYRGLGRYRPDHPFSTWLYRLAANHVIDRTRRLSRQRDRGELPAELGDGRPAADEQVERRERAAMLRQALARVRPRYREVLFLVYVEGFKVEEAARALGLPSGTVKTRLMRGREALRRLLVRSHPEYFGE